MVLQRTSVASRIYPLARYLLYKKAGVASAGIDLIGATELDGDKSFLGKGFAFNIVDKIYINTGHLKFDTQDDSGMPSVGILLDF